MRRLPATPLAIPLIVSGALAGCGGPEPGAEPQLRTVQATNLRLVGSPAPETRQLTVRYLAGALLWESKPVVRADVSQDATRVVVKVFLNERVPAADEDVPNIAAIRSTTVDLDQPLGRATVFDGSATPPAPMQQEQQ